MKSWHKTPIAVVAVIFMLVGCSANRSSVFRHKNITDGAAITVIDAKQRVILSATKTVSVGDTKTTYDRQFCTEPSPDVFSVVAQALSAGGTFGRSVDPKAIEAALTAAFSSSEQGSTIPRTQTINMLRELMFRTCERYINGGIGELELPLQAIRDQRLMVSILAIEQLTGMISPPPVIIGATADATAGASGAEAAVRIDDAFKDLQAKTASLQKRQNEFNEMNTESKDCDQISQAVQKKEEDKLSDALKAKRAKCESAASALAKAAEDRGQSAGHYAKLTDTASGGSIPVSAKADVMKATDQAAKDQANSEAIAGVAKSVYDIVNLNFEQDEFRLLCLKLVGPGGAKGNDELSSIIKSCADYLVSNIKLESQQKLAAADEIEKARMWTSGETSKLFEAVWKRASVDGKKADPSRVKALKQAEANWPTCFTDSGTKGEYFACFIELTSEPQRELEK